LSRSIRALLVVALTFSGLWVAGGAAPAYAYTGYQVVERTYSVPAGGYVRNIAQCPAGTVVLSGGASVVGSGSANFYTQLQESAPGTNGAGSVWLASVSNTSANNLTLGIFAVCGAAPAGYQILHSRVSLPTSGFIRQGVQCPLAERALAGGASVAGEGSADFNTEIHESGPLDGPGMSSWLTAVYNGSVNNHTVDLAAVCANPPAGYQVVQHPVTLPSQFSSPANFVRTTAVCPAGEVVLGGGAEVPAAGSADRLTALQESAPATASGNSMWLAAVGNHSLTAYTLYLYAICVS
jgi:hypothetical protein